MLGIVTTTIYDMPALDGYAESVVSFGREEEVQFYLVPDRKTDPVLARRVEAVRRRGLRVVYPTLDEQDEFLRRVGLHPDFIPYDSDNRRNVGYLMALADGAEFVISIDDDNFCPPQVDFVGTHLIALNNRNADFAQLSSNTGWVNVMDFLDFEPKVDIWPRGFPYYARKRVRYVLDTVAHLSRVAVHAGLWAGDPDVDAVSRLAMRPKVNAVRNGCVNVLSPQTWMPINTQNTSLTREALAAYYYVKMGYPISELRLDRFGDILSGYFVQACAKKGGHAVSFGLPLVEHRRTTHDLLVDLGQEYFGILIIEELLPWLVERRLNGTTYCERYCCLADGIASFAGSHSGNRWRSWMAHFLRESARLMLEWTRVVASLG